ncbi:MAG TPA: cupredoxin domain-containing protein [Candidatus Thermoplasmatota archaeon]|nr:cupredoxin domain-containing protein [Candidatus Thermoplasmatota archaeon]
MRAATIVLALVALAAPLAVAQEGQIIMLHMADFEFVPTSLTVPTGGVTVYAMNFGEVEHTVTSVDGLFDVQHVLPNEPQTFTAPAAAGSYRFYCAYHGDATGQGMAGTLVVSEDAANAPSPASPTPPTKKDAPAGALPLIFALVAAAALLRPRQAR